MTAKEKIKTLAKEHIIDILLAIYNGYDRAGKQCDPNKELRTQFNDLSYKNFRRAMDTIKKANFIFAKGSIVDRQYFINYKELDINIFY